MAPTLRRHALWRGVDRANPPWGATSPRTPRAARQGRHPRRGQRRAGRPAACSPARSPRAPAALCGRGGGRARRGPRGRPRANIDEFTDVTARALEDVGGAKQGKAIIILNPVEPPMIMRNTVFCAIPADAAAPGPRRDAIEANVHAMVDSVRRYVPGYTLRADPQFDPPDDRWRGMARVGVFLEVRGRGDYLPDYSGNLDIMTAAAAQVADLLAEHLTARREGATA